MPAYDYKCTACSTVFEITAPRPPAEQCCPECSAPAKRVFTPVGVHFKGSGFHNTDYKSRPKETDSSSASAPCGADKPASSG